jgi:pimeloyl-ACP methyl ester carboxylesterase
MRTRPTPRGLLRAAAGILLCILGFLLARATPFRETTVIVDATGCRLFTDIIDAGRDDVQGSVILLHGLAANKKLMSYLAQGFASLNLRVFVPDLPGHGRTPGPFSFARAETCSDALVRQLIARGAVDPARTILAGHSMGGALAVRLAAHTPVAGVIAISPAPMVSTYGVSNSMLIFTQPPATPANTLVISGSAEPRSIRDSARSLISGPNEASGKYTVIPGSTHVSLLFDPEVAKASEAWVSQVLKLEPPTVLPSRVPLAGSILGLFGVLLLAGPFLRETLGQNSLLAAGSLGDNQDAPLDEPHSPILAPGVVRSFLEIAAASIMNVLILRLWNPFGILHVFEGDYLAGFLLMLGVVLLLLHRNRVASLWKMKPGPLLAAAFAGIVLPLLIYSWFDLTISEAWMTLGRWLRFPALLVAALPYHAAEELLLGPARARLGKVRLLVALAFRSIIWTVLIGGIFLLHNGEILPLLLAPYFAVFCLLQRTGMDVVRKSTSSPLAAALFGAILLASFCVVVFPMT